MAKTSKFYFSGNETKARKLTGLAKIQLNKLRAFMERGNLKQYEMVLRDENGTVISASSVFGTEAVNVYVPPADIKAGYVRRRKTRKIRFVRSTVDGHYIAVSPSGYVGLWDTEDDDNYWTQYKVYRDTLSGALHYVPSTYTPIPTPVITVTEEGYRYVNESYYYNYIQKDFYLNINGLNVKFSSYIKHEGIFDGVPFVDIFGTDKFEGTVIDVYVIGTAYVYKAYSYYEYGGEGRFPLDINMVEAGNYTFWLREDGHEMLALAYFPPPVDLYRVTFLPVVGGKMALPVIHDESLYTVSKTISGVPVKILNITGDMFRYAIHETTTKIVQEGYRLKEGETLLEIEVEE